MAKTDFSKINYDMEQLSKKGGKKFKKKVPWYAPKPGDTTFSIGESISEDANLYEQVYVHFGFVDGEGNKRAYKCSKPAHGSCPICDQVAVMKKAGNTQDATKIEGKGLFLYNAVDVGEKHIILTLKITQHKEVMTELKDAHLNEIDGTDLAQGCQIKLTRLLAAPWARARMQNKRVTRSPEAVEALKAEFMDLKEVYEDFTPADLGRMLKGEAIGTIAPAKDKEEAPKEESKAPAPKKEAKAPEAKKEAPAPQKQEEEDDEITPSEMDADMDDIMSLLND